MGLLNTSIMNNFFMISTFILGILCLFVTFTTWPIFRTATICNTIIPSTLCKDKAHVTYAIYATILLLVVAVYFTYVRITSGL